MYQVPNFPDYSVNELGEVFNKYGQKRQAYTKDKTSKRLRIRLSFNGCAKTLSLSRVILSAKLCRDLEDFEEACHINGDPGDNRMCNLKAADRLNNIIDEIELGRIETTAEYRDLAVKRLLALDL